MMPTAAEAIAQARALMEEGDPPAAYGALRYGFRDPTLVTGVEPFVEAMQTFETIAQAIAGPAFAASIAAVIAEPEAAEPLIALASACTDEQLWWPAGCCLQRAAHYGGVTAALLEQQSEVAIADGQYATACEALRAAPDVLAQHATLRNRLALCDLLRGDLDAARKSATHVGTANARAHDEEIEAVQTMLARATHVEAHTPLDDTDLRGWHFVTSGGLLLHLSPFGFDDGMRGRYAMTQDSAARCRHGLVRLHAVLDEWDALPERVLLLPDRDSHILGLSAAALFGVTAEPYDETLAGLIVAYDLSTLDQSTPAAVAHHNATQMLFAHATCWTQPPPCVPDFTTYLYQYNQAPQIGLDAAESGTAKAPEANAGDEDATVELAVQAILDAVVTDDRETLPQDALEHVVTFATEVRAMAAASRTTGLRGPLISPGPVPSSRFN